MRNEHCAQSDSKKEFVTLNYGLRTSPANEWRIVITNDRSKATEHRVIPDYKELLHTDTAKRAGLLESEMIAVILYTGPMVIFLLLLRCCLV